MTIDAMTDERHLTAIHEAGHACVGLAFGLPVAIIAVAPDDAVWPSCEGFCSDDPDVGRVLAALEARPITAPVTLPGRRLSEWLIVKISGPVAEARVRGVPYRHGAGGGWRDGFEVDELIALAIRRSPMGRDVRAARRTYEAAAVDLVKKHWTWISLAAARLEQVGRLTGVEVLALRPTKGNR